MKDSILTKRQVKTVSKLIIVDGKKGRIEAKIRYDDECGNGHNSFAITGTVYSHPTSTADRFHDMGGCIHGEIIKHFPELEPFIKWHLMSSDEPMHYIANTMYHARDTDHDGKKVGEVIRTEKRITFEGVPMMFSEQEKGFWEYLDSVGDFDNIEVEAVPYDGRDSYDFSDNYSFTGFIKENEDKKWYKAPFKSKRAAAEFLEMFRFDYEYIEIPCAWVKAEPVDIEAARNCAIWPDATLEQLRDEKALKARLPQLMEQFAQDMELLGFTY